MKRSGIVFWILSLAAALSAAGQSEVSAPVRYTEARAHEVRRTVRLPGTVEAPATSVVASEVAGLVKSFPGQEGTAVRRGLPLVGLDTEALELRLQAAAGQLAEAEARLKSAELRLGRVRELLVSDVVSPQQVDDAGYEVEAWQGRVEQSRAEVARIKRDLARTTVRAPFDGVVVEEHTEVGEWVDVGDPVVELMRVDEIEVRVEVPERYFGNLTRGGTVEVGFGSMPDLRIEGTIHAIVPRADPQARTFPVKVRLPNVEGRVGVGMLAQVELPIGDSYSATIVPKDALVTEGQSTVVYLLDRDSAVQRVVVEAGAGVGSWVEVRGSLPPGAKVVTRGNERLRPGQPVAGEPMEYRLP